MLERLLKTQQTCVHKTSCNRPIKTVNEIKSPDRSKLGLTITRASPLADDESIWACSVIKKLVAMVRFYSESLSKSVWVDVSDVKMDGQTDVIDLRYMVLLLLVE